MTSIVIGIAVAAVVQEVLEDATYSLRISLERRRNRPAAAIRRDPAPTAKPETEPELTPMQQVEIAARSAATYEARWHSSSVLGTDGPLRDRSWTGAADGSATLDLPFGAVLRYQPAATVDGVSVPVPWDECYRLCYGSQLIVVRSGAHLLTLMQRLAEGRPLLGHPWFKASDVRADLGPELHAADLGPATHGAPDHVEPAATPKRTSRPGGGPVRRNAVK
ncbi:hypothetical protein ACIRPK_26540 [Kitasatospora sp. NPDC101801]|uniref:hypothetical protein n=1 Tax=Kitasatospora sp. NPDC101801 TaxID=3364103 RepID=UPI00381ECA24